jgi:predicted NAD/FAD-dependent oxidoreductase
MMCSAPLRIAVIGAGLAGLAAARWFRRAGHRTSVFDKGRRPGGRSSTRRSSGFSFDHGAQYFTAHDPRFRKLVDECLQHGVVGPWQGRLTVVREGSTRPVRGEAERFVGIPGMSALPGYLARGLEVRCRVRVSSAQHRGGAWYLRDEDGAFIGAFDKLVVTAPPAQAARLLVDAPELRSRASELVLRPCWAVMLGLAEPYAVPFDGAFCEESPLSWIARNNSKPRRAGGESWVLHASPVWTEAHLGDPPEQVMDLLCGALERACSTVLPEVSHRSAHRWRFALLNPGLDVGSLVDRERAVALAGDAYCGGRIEGAYLSGIDAAERLMASGANTPA